MDDIMIEVLLDEYHKGQKGDNGWKQQALHAIVNAINSNLGKNLNKENIRNRLKTWKKLYDAVHDALGQRGFRWNDMKNMLEAQADVWDAFLKSHPRFPAYLRYKSLPNFNDWSIFIGNDQANGLGAQTRIEADNENDTMPASFDNGIEDLTVNLDNVNDEETETPTPTNRKATDPNIQVDKCTRRRKKSNQEDNVTSQLKHLIANLRVVVDAIRDADKVDVSMLLPEIKKIQGFDDHFIIAACEYLSFDKSKTYMFLGLDEKLRKMWLLMCLRGFE